MGSKRYVLLSAFRGARTAAGYKLGRRLVEVERTIQQAKGRENKNLFFYFN